MCRMGVVMNKHHWPQTNVMTSKHGFPPYSSAIGSDIQGIDGQGD